MCGRYSLNETPAMVRSVFGYKDQPNFPPRYNIAPTQPIAIVRSEHGVRRFALVRWGLVPQWVKDPANFTLLINARAETAVTKPSFRSAMRHGRCLVPASGFYEWQKGPDGQKQPYWIHPRDGGVIGFAGLWETYSHPDGGDIDTGLILTTKANGFMRPIHDRMPAVIMPSEFEAWLDTDHLMARDAAELLKPASDDLFEAIPVSTRVNSTSFDEAALQDEADPIAPKSAPRRRSAPRKTEKNGSGEGGEGGGQLDLF